MGKKGEITVSVLLALIAIVVTITSLLYLAKYPVPPYATGVFNIRLPYGTYVEEVYYNRIETFSTTPVLYVWYKDDATRKYLLEPQIIAKKYILYSGTQDVQLSQQLYGPDTFDVFGVFEQSPSALYNTYSYYATKIGYQLDPTKAPETGLYLASSAFSYKYAFNCLADYCLYVDSFLIYDPETYKNYPVLRFVLLNKDDLSVIRTRTHIIYLEDTLYIPILPPASNTTTLSNYYIVLLRVTKLPFDEGYDVSTDIYRLNPSLELGPLLTLGSSVSIPMYVDEYGYLYLFEINTKTNENIVTRIYESGGTYSIEELYRSTELYNTLTQYINPQGYDLDLAKSIIFTEFVLPLIADITAYPPKNNVIFIPIARKVFPYLNDTISTMFVIRPFGGSLAGYSYLVFVSYYGGTLDISVQKIQVPYAQYYNIKTLSYDIGAMLYSEQSNDILYINLRLLSEKGDLSDVHKIQLNVSNYIQYPESTFVDYEPLHNIPIYRSVSGNGYVIPDYNVKIGYGLVGGKEVYYIQEFSTKQDILILHPITYAELISVETISIPLAEEASLSVTNVVLNVPEYISIDPYINVTVYYELVNLDYAYLKVYAYLEDLYNSAEVQVSSTTNVATLSFDMSDIVRQLIQRGVRGDVNVTVIATLYYGNLSHSRSATATTKIVDIPVSVSILSPTQNQVFNEGELFYLRINITDTDTYGTYSIVVKIYDKYGRVVDSITKSVYLSRPQNYVYEIPLQSFTLGENTIGVTVTSPDSTSSSDSVKIYINKIPTVSIQRIEGTEYFAKYKLYILPSEVEQVQTKLLYQVFDEAQLLTCSIYINNIKVKEEIVYAGDVNEVTITLSRGINSIKVECADPHGAIASAATSVLVDSPERNSIVCEYYDGYWTGTHCCGNNVGEDKYVGTVVGYVYIVEACKYAKLPEGYCTCNDDCGYTGWYCANETYREYRVYTCDPTISEPVTITIDGREYTVTLNKCTFTVTNVEECPTGYICQGAGVCLAPGVSPNLTVKITYPYNSAIFEKRYYSTLEIPISFTINTNLGDVARYDIYVNDRIAVSSPYLTLIQVGEYYQANISANITIGPANVINANRTINVRVVVIVANNSASDVVSFVVYEKPGFDSELYPPDVHHVVRVKPDVYELLEVNWTWAGDGWEPFVTSIVTLTKDEIPVILWGRLADIIDAPSCVSPIPYMYLYRRVCDASDPYFRTVIELIPQCVNGTIQYIQQTFICPENTWCPPGGIACVPLGQCIPPEVTMCINETYAGVYENVFNPDLGRCEYRLKGIIPCAKSCNKVIGKCDVGVNARPWFSLLSIPEKITIGGEEKLESIVEDDDPSVEFVIYLNDIKIYSSWISTGVLTEVELGKLVEEYGIQEGNYTIKVVSIDPLFAYTEYATTIEVVAVEVAPPAAAAPSAAPPVVEEEVPAPVYPAPPALIIARESLLGLVILAIVGIVGYILYRRYLAK